MATAGMDRQLKIFDVRTYKPLQAYRVSHGAGQLSFSQRGLLAASLESVVEVSILRGAGVGNSLEWGGGGERRDVNRRVLFKIFS